MRTDFDIWQRLVTLMTIAILVVFGAIFTGIGLLAAFLIMLRRRGRG